MRLACWAHSRNPRPNCCSADDLKILGIDEVSRRGAVWVPESKVGLASESDVGSDVGSGGGFIRRHQQLCLTLPHVVQPPGETKLCRMTLNG